MVLYTGTHDNNTLRGWFEEEIGPGEKERIASVLGRLPDPSALSREMITLAEDSPARVVIVPVQDLLGLSSEARMNRPGTTEGNWRWKLCPGELGDDDWAWLFAGTLRSGRCLQEAGE
jgi:4-alpha-glucanotransferase